MRGEYLETPFLINQVETHLILGPLSRHLKVGYLILAAATANFMWEAFTPQKPLAQHVGGTIDNLVFLFVLGWAILKLTQRQQAIVTWIGIKGGFGIAAFLLMTIGAGTSFERGSSDAWPNLLLGLIWIPGIEFVPSITPNQKYVTLARMGLSIPLIYMGIMSGNWHWQ